MKKFWIQIVVLLAVIFGAMFLSFNANTVTNQFNLNPSGNTQNNVAPKRQILVGSTELTVEVVDSSDERRKGLGGKDALAEREGMLFVFPEEKKYRFWMKGMKFPLDMVFIRQGKVVDIIKNVPLPLPNQQDSDLAVYEPVTVMDMLLEINAGYADKFQIKVGDTVSLIE